MSVFETIVKEGIGVMKKSCDAAISLRDACEEGGFNLMNTIAYLSPKMMPVPSKAKKIFVFFVIPSEGHNSYVCGFYMSEYEKIMRYINEDKYSHIFFIYHKTEDVGIQPIAAGDEWHKEYALLDRGQLCKFRAKNSKYTIIACPEDVDYLKVRFKTLDCGIVLTRAEAIEIFKEYMKLSSHQGLGSDASIYQAVLDMAMTVKDRD